MDNSVICPKCGDDAIELSSRNPVTYPHEGQQVGWITRLSCGCTVKDYHVWYEETGWV